MRATCGADRAMRGSPAVIGLDTIVGFLLDRALLTPEQVVAGVTVDPLPRRNSNLRVSTSDGSGVFVKQADGQAEGSARTVRAEGMFYAAQAARPAAGMLSLPRLVHFDPDRPLLVLELLPSHRPLLEYARDQPAHRFPMHAWRRLGDRLGAIHRCLRLFPADTSDTRAAVPWVVTTPRPFIESLSTLSSGTLSVVEVVQQSGLLTNGLQLVEELWQDEQLIHGDVRADNVLVRAEPPGGPDLRLVDWEMHRRGDPLWDVAGALDMLVLERLSAVAANTYDPEIPILPEVVLQAASCALWDAYLSNVAPLPPRPGPVEQTLTAYCAARLVETAVEGTGYLDELPEFVVLALQVAENLFADPRHGITRLLGIG
jgi:hypothetical protein